MSRVYPQTHSSSSDDDDFTANLKPESFTIWMKSLVFNTHGCTIYNSKGEIVYRVDNYDNKCGQEVYLMDISGKILFSLLRKKLRLFGCWNGYKWDACSAQKQLWFRVRKHRSILVSMCDGIAAGGSECTYKIVRMDCKLGFKIVDADADEVVAEIKQKQTTTGICFGNDVFTLTVQPHVDQSLIMAIVMVYGLINNQI